MRMFLAVVSFVAVPLVASAHGRVLVESNATDANTILVFDHRPDGTLAAAGAVATGGRGSGVSLGSQGALALADGGRRLYAVNAGSNDVSVFDVTRGALTLVGRTATAGTQPVSVAVRGDRAYVLDAGGDGDVSVFRVGHGGRLTLLGSRALANRAPGPAEVAVAPSGDVLVVTEKNTSCIDTFVLDRDGLPGAAKCHASAGATPFGFAFAPTARDWLGNRYDTLVVSEAEGGAAGAATVSTYVVAGGEVSTVAAAERTEQTAACWIALADGGRFVYATDAGSGVVTGFRLHGDGALGLLASDGKSGDTGAGSHPIDATVAGDTLFVLDSATPALDAFAVHRDGGLTHVATATAVPAFAAGLVAE